jgi:uncharacterized protein (DUF849 family)
LAISTNRVAPVILQAALNGPFAKDHHPAVPVSIDELARDAAECVAVGANAIHLHPRDAAGAEQLDAEVVDAVVVAVRGRCGVPVGVSTGAWIEPDPDRRAALVSAWRAPDYASVNLSEAGADAVMRALLAAGIGIEAGISALDDVERLHSTGLSGQLTRVLVEPVEVRAANAVSTVDAIHAALDRLGVAAPRLQHGDGEATWPLLEDAVHRGLDTRIGLEDTVLGPAGERIAGNAALVRAASELAARG